MAYLLRTDDHVTQAGHMVDELDEKKITVRWWVLFNMFVQRRPNSVQFGLESYCEGQSTCLFISFFQSSDHSGSGRKHLSLFLHSFHSGFFPLSLRIHLKVRLRVIILSVKTRGRCAIPKSVFYTEDYSYLQAWKNIHFERGAGESCWVKAPSGLLRLSCDSHLNMWRVNGTLPFCCHYIFSAYFLVVLVAMTAMGSVCPLWNCHCLNSFFLLADVRLFKIKPLSFSFFASFLKCPTESGSEGSDKNLLNRERIKRGVHVHGQSALWTKDAPPDKYHYPGITLRFEIWHKQLSSPSVPGHLMLCSWSQLQANLSSLSFHIWYLLITVY